MSMTAEPVAWFVDWPGEPDLGHFLGEEPVEGARNRALVFRDAAPVSAEPVGKLECHVSGDATFWPDEAKVLALPVGEHAVYTAPVAAQAQPESAELREARHDSAHAETESERVRALAYWLEQQTYEPDMLSNAADTLRAYLEEKNQAQPLPDSLVPTAPDLEYLRDAAENTALPAFLRGQIAAAVKELATKAQPEDDSIALDRLADYIADTWPMDKKYGLEEICQRLHAMWPGEFIPVDVLAHNDVNVREALRALLLYWDRFQKSDGNQHDAYNLLVKAAHHAWQFARTEIERVAAPCAQAQPNAPEADIVDSQQRILDAAFHWAECRDIGPSPAKTAWRELQLRVQNELNYTWSIAKDDAQAQQDADTVDAERYRAWRDALITGKTAEDDFIRLVADNLPTSVGVSRRPTAAEWDAAIDAARKEQA